LIFLLALASGWVMAAPTPQPSLSPSPSAAQSNPAPDSPELVKLLREFLAGASRNDVATHERFWADDLIYTSSTGRRIGKADILREVRQDSPSKPNEGVTLFTAEDIQVHQYSDAAIVAFRLVGTTRKGDKTEVANYLNTGTFVRRNGEWRAVAWQATALSKPEKTGK
jgi:ketosteroid isomerase-like protein